MYVYLLFCMGRTFGLDSAQPMLPAQLLTSLPVQVQGVLSSLYVTRPISVTRGRSVLLSLSSRASCRSNQCRRSSSMMGFDSTRELPAYC